MTFEVFRDGNVPDCERRQDITDPFNDPAGIDPDSEEEDEESEEIF